MWYLLDKRMAGTPLATPSVSRYIELLNGLLRLTLLNCFYDFEHEVKCSFDA